jgi:hypothetical protein
VAQAVQFGEFDDPHTAGLHGGILALQIGKLIGEVFAGKRSQGGLFADALRAFENEAAIRLRPWAENPCHR